MPIRRPVKAARRMPYGFSRRFNFLAGVNDREREPSARRRQYLGPRQLASRSGGRGLPVTVRIRRVSALGLCRESHSARAFGCQICQGRMRMAEGNVMAISETCASFKQGSSRFGSADRQVTDSTLFNDWKRFCFVLREIASGVSGRALSGLEAQKRARGAQRVRLCMATTHPGARAGRRASWRSADHMGPIGTCSNPLPNQGKRRS